MFLRTAAALALIASPLAAQDTSATATAMMMDADGAEIGRVEFVEGPNGVLVSAVLEGLPEGGHGFHIHETGACEPDFTAAGDHYNPDGQEHGFLVESGPHAGDLPNVFASADGTVTADMFTDRFSLAEGDLNDDDGAAVIVHTSPDSYGDEASAGDRIACGVIEFGG